MNYTIVSNIILSIGVIILALGAADYINYFNGKGEEYLLAASSQISKGVEFLFAGFIIGAIVQSKSS